MTRTKNKNAINLTPFFHFRLDLKLEGGRFGFLKMVFFDFHFPSSVFLVIREMSGFNDAEMLDGNDSGLMPLCRIVVGLSWIYQGADSPRAFSWSRLSFILICFRPITAYFVVRNHVLRTSFSHVAMNRKRKISADRATCVQENDYMDDDFFADDIEMFKSIIAGNQETLSIWAE